MNSSATKILKAVAKNGEIPLSVALRLNKGKTKNHIDQYPLALLLESDYLGISISSKDPEGMENMREMQAAITLHMYTLPEDKMGARKYMGITGQGSIKPEDERVFIKAKGLLYLEEQRTKFRERIYSFVIGIFVGIIAASFSAWIQGQIRMP
jgi:hypothetical protein